MSTRDAHCTKCGRPIRSARALETSLGESCRRRVYRAARMLLASKSESAKKAADLLLDAPPIRLASHGGRVWRTVNQDGQRTYLTTIDHCTCPAGIHCRLCYHSAAVAVMAA
jgi:hypothetical protein